MGSEPSYQSGRAAPPDPDTRRLPVGPGDESDTGTGWPADQAMVRMRPRGGALRWGARRLFRVPRFLAWLAGIVVVIVLLGIGLRAVNLLPHFSNPFASKKTDRTGPVLLLSIQDLSRFEAASGNFQVIVDLQKDKSLIPDIIFNQRTLFVAAGTVDAYVDFSHIGQGDITDSADHRTVSIRLPAPVLDRPNLDVNRSQVISVQEGVVNRIGDLFGNNPNKEQELYQAGAQKIAQAAQDSGLAQRAADNTRRMLEQLLRSLGYTTVTVTFVGS